MEESVQEHKRVRKSPNRREASNLSIEGWDGEIR